MVYIPPQGLNLNQDELNQILVVNNKNIYELMRVFSGINDPNHPINNPTLFDFWQTYPKHDY